MKGMSVGQCAAMLPGLGHQLLKEYPGESLSVTLGFGNMFWLLVWHAQQPRGLDEFEGIDSGDIEFPATEGDLFIYYTASRLDLIEKISNEANHHLKGMVDLLEEVTSENPSLANNKVDVSGIFIGSDEPEFGNGCFVLAQKFECQEKENHFIKPLAKMAGHRLCGALPGANTRCRWHIYDACVSQGTGCYG